MRKYIILLLVALVAVIAIAENEISTSITLKVKKDAISITRQTGTTLIDMAGTRYNVQTINASTNNTRLSKGAVVTPGWAYMRNLSTNETEKVFISFDSGTTTSLVFEAEEAGTFRVAPDAIITNFMVATTNGTCDFEFTVIED